MKQWKKMLLLAGVMLMAVALLAGCGGTKDTAKKDDTKTEETAQLSGSMTISGSTALQPLVEQAAQIFMEKNPQSEIGVQGGGSGTGLAQVSQGAVDVGNSDIFAEEKEGVNAAELVDHKVAVVGFAAVVNPGVKVDNVTQEQLIGIFTGKITNWKELGGDDQKIVVVNRAKGSGTRASFKKYGLKGAEEVEGMEEDSSGTVHKIIAETPGAISYLALSYIDSSIKALKLDGVEANAENITAGQYPIWSYEHMYTKGEPSGLAKAFLDYMVNEENQKSLVKELDYIPVTDMKVERSAK